MIAKEMISISWFSLRKQIIMKGIWIDVPALKSDMEILRLLPHHQREWDAAIKEVIELQGE